MIFKTRTSTYEINKEGDEFALEKKSLDEGVYSRVSVGRTFTAKVSEIAITCAGCLDFGSMNTSPIQNIDELRKWLIGNGINPEYLS
jgi:hypothetical protein